MIEREANQDGEVDRVDKYFRTQREVFTEKSHEDLQLEILKASGFFEKIPEIQKKLKEEAKQHS